VVKKKKREGETTLIKALGDVSQPGRVPTASQVSRGVSNYKRN